MKRTRHLEPQRVADGGALLPGGGGVRSGGLPARDIASAGVKRNRDDAPRVEIINARNVVEVERGAVRALVEDAAESHHRIVRAGVAGLDLQPRPEDGIGLFQPGLRRGDALPRHARVRVVGQRVIQRPLQRPRFDRIRPHRKGQPEAEKSQWPFHFVQQEAPHFSLSEHEPPTPSFLRMISSGQKLVNEDWSRLKPTKAVNQSQYGL